MKSRYLLLIVLLVLSCNSTNKDLYQFDPKTITESKIALSEIADDIFYIPLDNSFPIGLIYEPQYFINNSIYLSAVNIGIMVFDRNGKFLRKIGSIGRGPGEYNTYYQFTVDDKSETVYVLDARTINVYSKTGNFLRSISFADYGNSVDDIELYNSKLLLSFRVQNEDAKYDWIVLDTLGNLVMKKKRADLPFSVNWGINGGLYKLENKIYYWNPWRDTILTILPDLTYEPSFLFSQWENRVPISKITDLSQFQLFNDPKSLFETKQFIVCDYKYQKRLCIALIDKKSKKSYITYLESGPAAIGNNFIGGFFNDLDGGVRFQPDNYYAENNREYIFGLINSFQLKAQVMTNDFKNSIPKYPEKKKELEQLANRLKETDNQILMIIRLNN